VSLFTFFYIPKTDKIAKLKSEHAQLVKKRDEYKARLRDLPKLRLQAKYYEEKFEAVKRKLPEKEEIPSLLASISQSGRNSNLEFVLFQPQAEVVKDFYAAIPVNMSVTGDYHSVGIFFNKVANLPRIVNIGNITMAPAPSGKPDSGPTVLTTNARAETYKFIDAPEKPNKKKGKS
jgi:type IV pilus assembly protein PilO